MADSSYPEVALKRSARNGEQESEPGAATRTSRRIKRAATAENKSRKDEKPPIDPEERLRHFTAVLLLVFSVFLLLALVSYTPLDQANTDVGIRDLFGVFSNDPVVAAKADTTENWAGLTGAVIANFFINGITGYTTLIVPFLLGLWAITIYRGQNYSKSSRRSIFVFLLMVQISSIFGTIQTVSWMPHPAHEWAGNVGAFIGTIFSNLLGAAGSLLLLVTAMFITLVYFLQIDVRMVVDRLRTASAGIRDQAKAASATLTNKLGEQKTGDDGGVETSQQNPGAKNAVTDEPARMMRRIQNIMEDDGPARRANGREAAPAPEKKFSEPKIRRPEPPTMPIFDPPPPSPTAKSVSGSENLSQTSSFTARSEPAGMRGARPDEESAPAAPIAIGPQSNGVDTDNVELRQGDPQPVLAPINRYAAPKLTLNVQDAETDADLETEDDGAIIERLKNEQIRYVPPPIELLAPQSDQPDVNDEELKENGRILQEKLATFNIQIENLTVTPGPVVTLYEFVPAAGIKIARVEALADDIALALKARGIRIIAPIPGKGTVGVEIPNHKPAMVRFRSVVNTSKFRESNQRLPLALGKTTVGEVFVDDLSKMPHLLIAGATGSGKSVGINSILASLIYKMHPSDLKLVIIDPKKIELSLYRALRDHFLARCPDVDEEIITNPQNAVITLKSLELEMDRRYDILAKVGQRNIFDYNQKVAEGKYEHDTEFHHVKLPYIVLILDELADLMITAAKEVEEPIARLAQLARAIGIHLVVATQRPSVDVITGVIKANFPARIAYQVASKIDSRTILDMNGAEYLLGNGDMLYLPGGSPKPLRLQNAFISTEEIEMITEHIGKQKGYTRPYVLPSVLEKQKTKGIGAGGERDELFDEAARLIVRHQQGSVSLIQRRLKVGYSRAARIVDELEMAGIVGPFDGSKARAVLLESEAELEAFL